MEKVNIEIGGKQYLVEVAVTQKEKEVGLQGRTKLENSEGMLFDFSNEDGYVSMWMKDTLIPLDIIFINDDQEVTYVAQGVPNTTKKVSALNTAYVLEVNVNSGIKEGDELTFEDGEDPPVMKVLAQDGSTQMELWGGERIFRRAFTKQLITWAKKANEVKNDPDEFDKICKRIGRKMFKEIKAQDNRPPEYVENPNG